MQKYAFLDRDGTFLWEPERPEGVDPRETFPLKSMDEFKFMEGAIEGIRKLADKEYKLVMVTNQTFLGTPKHPKEMFDKVMEKIDEELAKYTITFEFKMVCPHGPDEGCDCRKPQIGGLEDFLREHEVDFTHSIMFGDRTTDEEFAKNIGIRFVKVKTNEHFVVPDDI
ncbi:MAG: HAD-IIIA family hydrolase [Parcubacteria group bacterium]|nr:HAD-IIIA family hydrolase [Parcubacteria group bacterium]